MDPYMSWLDIVICLLHVVVNRFVVSYRWCLPRIFLLVVDSNDLIFELVSLSNLLYCFFLKVLYLIFLCHLL